MGEDRNSGVCKPPAASVHRDGCRPGCLALGEGRGTWGVVMVTGVKADTGGT
jgi:hypothetical protein